MLGPRLKAIWVCFSGKEKLHEILNGCESILINAENLLDKQFQCLGRFRLRLISMDKRQKTMHARIRSDLPWAVSSPWVQGRYHRKCHSRRGSKSKMYIPNNIKGMSENDQHCSAKAYAYCLMRTKGMAHYSKTNNIKVLPKNSHQELRHPRSTWPWVAQWHRWLYQNR